MFIEVQRGEPMAVQIRLTERQQRLAADELDQGDLGSDSENKELLQDAGFDFIEGEDSEDSDDSEETSSKTGTQQDREYIEDGLPLDDDGEQSSGGSVGDTDRDLPDWVDDRVRDYASSYGITDEDLADFGSFDQLRRVGTMLDRRFTSAAQDNLDSQDSQSGSGEQGLQGAGAGEQVSGGTSTESKDPGPLDRLKPLDRKRYEEAKYGDAELDLVDQLNATIEVIRQFMPGIQQQTEKQLSQQQAEVEREFHQTLDELDPELYGKAVDGDKIVGRLNPAFQESRRAVQDAMLLIQRGIIRDAEQRGVQPEVPSVRALAMRAAQIVGHQVSAQAGQQVNRQQAMDQSRRRRPVGTGGRSRGTVAGGAGKGAVNSGSGETDDVKQILSSPAIAQFWKQTQRENGVT